MRLALIILMLIASVRAGAADHRDGPIITGYGALDINDLYLFLDPGNNGFAVLAITVNSFIEPSENASTGFFDDTMRFRFEIDNTGDANGDFFVEVTHSKRIDPATPQTATITLREGTSSYSFKALTTPATGKLDLRVPTPAVTTDRSSGISYFGGLMDDTFYFDLGAANAYLKSRESGVANPELLKRGRDSFANTNNLAVVLRVPMDMINGPSNAKVLGLAGVVQHRSMTYLSITDPTSDKTMGQWMNMDRMGLPLINGLILSYTSRDLYNRSNTDDDAKLVFRSEIRQTLSRLGTDAAHVRAIEGLAVERGDMLRLDTSIPNSGLGGGDNAAAAFPNGRRPHDDVADVMLGLISNGEVISDAVDRNEVAMRNSFPFFAPPHQP